MNDNIKAEILYGETVLDILEKYSVKTYCENQITKTAQELGLNNSQYITFKRLIADLLTYGAAAQEYMQYNIDNYVDSSLWVSEHKSAFVVPDGVKKISGNTDENNRVKSVSLNISNVNKIYFRLVLTDENIKVLLNGTEIDKERLVSQEDGTYLFYTDGLKATEFDKVFVLTLVDGENNEISRVEYNVLAYVEAKYNSATVGNITKALNNYGSSAKKYFKSLTQDNGDIDFEDEDEI